MTRGIIIRRKDMCDLCILVWVVGGTVYRWTDPCNGKQDMFGQAENCHLYSLCRFIITLAIGKLTTELRFNGH